MVVVVAPRHLARVVVRETARAYVENCEGGLCLKSATVRCGLRGACAGTPERVRRMEDDITFCAERPGGQVLQISKERGVARQSRNGKKMGTKPVPTYPTKDVAGKYCVPFGDSLQQQAQVTGMSVR